MQDPSDGASRFGPWAEIPGAGIFCRLIPQALRQGQVAGQRLEDMLPRANCFGMANGDRLLGDKRSDAIGDEPVFRPIPTPMDFPPPNRVPPHFANTSFPQTERDPVSPP